MLSVPGSRSGAGGREETTWLPLCFLGAASHRFRSVHIFLWFSVLVTLKYFAIVLSCFDGILLPQGFTVFVSMTFLYFCCWMCIVVCNCVFYCFRNHFFVSAKGHRNERRVWTLKPFDIWSVGTYNHHPPPKYHLLRGTQLVLVWLHRMVLIPGYLCPSDHEPTRRTDGKQHIWGSSIIDKHTSLTPYLHTIRFNLKKFLG